MAAILNCINQPGPCHPRFPLVESSRYPEDNNNGDNMFTICRQTQGAAMTFRTLKHCHIHQHGTQRHANQTDTVCMRNCVDSSILAPVIL